MSNTARQFDPDLLLAHLPRRPIGALPAAVELPRRRSVGNLSEYNGFTGKERLRTFEIAKWLVRHGAMEQSEICNLCDRACGGQHAEDYYDLATWIDMCGGCHTRLHQRFRYPAAWPKWLDSLETSDDHWARLVAVEPFDLAGLLRERGTVEPRHEDFVAAPATK